eukprot:CAMPEP_0174586484 /NCGR_PEP_ID=MMETSP0929-20130131/26857_1 /TAXON_ID=548131 ORGANISM="Ostreococcus mediterraneus, Strain clade-D-RCC2572" /NCGR_SAMPLE_ID=MMETSP0929 /ASSEMBLY_ACC=CAM_ASM_000573 /LENGTH=52 /DNA_ID=CAMNT_0015768501 /DNA_START=580 /DNA_END=734 /DNA_ORIENTATION=-
MPTPVDLRAFHRRARGDEEHALIWMFPHEMRRETQQQRRFPAPRRTDDDAAR